MTNRRLQLLRVTLLACAAYYLVGTLAHFFGLTIFPWYDRQLYAPYHDTLLALCGAAFVLIFLAIAKDPIKNADMIKVIIASFTITIFFNLYIIWKIDFTALGSSIKKLQTIFETALAILAIIALLALKPKNANPNPHIAKVE